MTLDEIFREQISCGQPPLVALHNAANAYAAELSTKKSITHGLVKEIPKCRTTLYARYDELEDRLRSIGSRKYQVRYLDGFVRIVVEPEESAKQMEKDCSQYADETAAWGNEHDVQAIKHLSDQIDEVVLRIDHGGMDALVQLSDRFRKLVDRWRNPQGDKPQDCEAVELLREGDRLMASRTTWTSAEMLWHDRVRNFLEWKR